MDRKTVIILAVAVLALCLISPIVDFFIPPQKASATNDLASNALPVTSMTNVVTSAATTNSAAPVAVSIAEPTEPEQTLFVTNQNHIYEFTSYGGGLKSVALHKFPAVVGRARASGDAGYATLNANTIRAVTADDLTDAPGIARRLADRRDDFGSYLASLTNSNLGDHAAAYVNNKEALGDLEYNLAYGFNQTIANADFARSAPTNGLQLRPETRELLARHSAGAETARLNRLLLEDAFPGQLSRHHDLAPMLAIIQGREVTNEIYTLTRSNSVVRAERTQANGLRIVKTFDVGDNGTNFLFTASLSYENTSGAALRVPDREVVIGNSAPIGPLDDPTTVGTMWYNGNSAVDIDSRWFANRKLGCIPGTPRTIYDEGASNVVWAAPHTQYFAMAAVPAQPAPGLTIRPILIAPPDTNGVNYAPRDYLLTNAYQATFDYPGQILPPHQSFTQSFTFYAGPKKYFDLSKIGLAMGNNLDLVMGFTGFLGFGFFSKMLLLSMNGIAATGLTYGFCIIAITVIIKLIFWPIMAASTRSQKRLQALQPQIKAISDKYKDDPLKKHEKTTAFLKENKINPLGSCLPMMIQIPVFFGFYSMLRNAIELRGVPFLWAHDLSQPDTVGYLLGFPINPLPLIMGATQLWQAQLTPPQPGVDPAQQRVMKFMPLIFIAFFYRMSAGLTVYWTVSNLLTILQTKMTRTGPDTAGGKAVVAAGRKR